MRYVIQTTFEQELNARKEYLYLVFHLWFIEVKRNKQFITLESIPSNTNDIYMITGHFPNVGSYIHSQRNEIGNKTVVINSCFPNSTLRQLNLKNVFFSKTDQEGYSKLRNGKAFGLDFNVTDSELNLLNAESNNIDMRIEKAYQKIA